MGSATAITFNVQKFSTEDGPGIRTTVFLKGCPLRCAWCHNPEGISPSRELMWFDVRCIGARDCIQACPEDALCLSADGMQIDRARCSLCGDCVQACPTAAFELIGEEWSQEALLTELLKDRVFYETSGGGVTFSGGEPMLQADFLESFLPECQSAGLHVALDTCGAAARTRYAALLPFIDLVLLDLKMMDADRHRAATGVDNALILGNACWMAERGQPIWVRTPVIPGYTDSVEAIRAIAAFIRDHMPTVERWDLLAYTNLGRPKYHRLDLPYALEDQLLMAQETMEALWQAAVAVVPCARWSGATRLETRAQEVTDAAA